jgi:hypothetical protein
MEVLIRGKLCGATRRTSKDGQKTYAEVSVAVNQVQSADAIGFSVDSYRLDARVFDSLRKVPHFADVVVVCEERSFRRDDGNSDVYKIAVDVIPGALTMPKVA